MKIRETIETSSFGELVGMALMVIAGGCLVWFVVEAFLHRPIPMIIALVIALAISRPNWW